VSLTTTVVDYDAVMVTTTPSLHLGLNFLPHHLSSEKNKNEEVSIQPAVAMKSIKS
jgi:hypothetical protein